MSILNRFVKPPTTSPKCAGTPPGYTAKQPRFVLTLTTAKPAEKPPAARRPPPSPRIPGRRPVGAHPHRRPRRATGIRIPPPACARIPGDVHSWTTPECAPSPRAPGYRREPGWPGGQRECQTPGCPQGTAGADRASAGTRIFRCLYRAVRQAIPAPTTRPGASLHLPRSPDACGPIAVDAGVIRGRNPFP